MHYINTFVNSMPQLLTVGGYWFIGIIVLLEGLPIVGALLPGHIIIIVAGFLTKVGVFDLGTLLIVAISAAIVGDIIGFLLGRRYGDGILYKIAHYVSIKDEHIEKAKRLIDNNTGKTIILGKFSPVTRPLTPFLVGASGVHIRTFWFFNTIGSILWVVVSVMIGYIFGASYDIVARYFGTLIFIAIVSSILIILAYRFVNTRFHIFKKYELFVLGLNLISLWTLAKTIQDSLSATSFMANFDISTNLFMIQHVLPSMMPVWNFITNIGSTVVMIVLGLSIGLVFLFKQKWRRAFIMLSSIILTAGAVTFMKHLFMRSRPNDALSFFTDPSFPSGHAALAAAFFVALAYICAPRFETWVKREAFIALSVVLVILIGLSRVILNVHWASDVIAGWSLGIFIASSSILLVRYAGAMLWKKLN